MNAAARKPKYKFAAIDAKSLVAGMRIISPTHGESPLVTDVGVKGKMVHVRVTGLKRVFKFAASAGLMVRSVGA